MAKISYANLKLKTDTSVSTFNYLDNKIEILNYLPINDKYDLIMITLQKAEEEDCINPIKLEIYFNLHLIYMYSNLSFTEKQKEDELKLYDTLKCNGFIDEFLKAMNEEEYQELFDMLLELVEKKEKYKLSIIPIINKITNEIPSNAAAAMELVNNFDKSKFQEVIDFSRAANGNRPL